MSVTIQKFIDIFYEKTTSMLNDINKNESLKKNKKDDLKEKGTVGRII